MQILVNLSFPIGTVGLWDEDTSTQTTRLTHSVKPCMWPGYKRLEHMPCHECFKKSDPWEATWREYMFIINICAYISVIARLQIAQPGYITFKHSDKGNHHGASEWTALLWEHGFWRIKADQFFKPITKLADGNYRFVRRRLGTFSQSTIKHFSNCIN